MASLNLITIVAYPVDNTGGGESDMADESAFVFFLIACITLFLCVVTYAALLKLPIVVYYMALVERSKQALPEKTQTKHISDVVSAKKMGKKWHDKAHELAAARVGPMKLPMLQVFKLIWRNALMVAWVFFITLSVFPNIAVAVQSQYGKNGTDAGDDGRGSPYGNQLFIPIYCFIGFNLGDYIGRTAAGKWQYPKLKNMGMMKYPIVLRTLFIPLFFMCQLNFNGDYGGPDTAQPTSMIHVNGDAFPYILMLALGITNGYYGTLWYSYPTFSHDSTTYTNSGTVTFIVFP